MGNSYKAIKAEGSIYTLDVILRTARFWWIKAFKFQYNSFFLHITKRPHFKLNCAGMARAN